MNHLFCVNALLCCSSVSSPMPVIYSCRAIRLRHVLCLSDCPTSFMLLILTLPLLLMVHASTLSAILYSESAAASGNLMSASSISSAHESSDLNSLASDAMTCCPSSISSSTSSSSCSFDDPPRSVTVVQPAVI